MLITIMFTGDITYNVTNIRTIVQQSIHLSFLLIQLFTK
jgi:hypothetical protein